MRKTTPPWAFGLLLVNVAPTILVPLTQLSVTHLPNWRDLWNTMAYSIAYGNSIAIPAVLLMPRLVAFLATRRLPLVPVIVACSIAFAALGCLIGEAVVVWIERQRRISSGQTFRAHSATQLCSRWSSV